MMENRKNGQLNIVIIIFMQFKGRKGQVVDSGEILTMHLAKVDVEL